MVKKGLAFLVLSALISFGCREIPTLPEIRFSKERVAFGSFPQKVHTKNGEFEISYGGGRNKGLPFNINFGYLTLKYAKIGESRTIEVNSKDKNKIYLTSEGATREYSRGDPLIAIQDANFFFCGGYLMTPY